MTEYELVDAANGIASNIMVSQTIFLSILFAYLILAYVAGSKLTTFQAGFLSFIFLVACTSGTTAFLGMLAEVMHDTAKLNEIRSENIGFGTLTRPTLLSLVAIRMVMILGALYFMWSVRHPRTE